MLVGIDTDRDSIEIARDRARSAPAPLELHLASAERMPFTSDYFDVAVAVFVVGAMPGVTRGRVLTEARRVLKPGGRLIVVDWARGGCIAARIAYEVIDDAPPLVVRAAPARRAGMPNALVELAGSKTSTGAPATSYGGGCWYSWSSDASRRACVTHVERHADGASARARRRQSDG